MGYLRTTFNGISWMGSLRVLTRSFAILKTVILARILLPSQFGTYGIALLVLGFLEILTETGINIFLVQEKEKIDDYINSAWVVSIFRGILISVLILASIPFITSFFNSPESKNILLLVSLVPFVRGFINPSIVKFQKNLQFSKQFFYDAPLALIDIIVAITLGVLTKSENALIWGMLISALVEVFISFFVVKPRPTFKIEIEKVKKVINRGKWITGAGIFNYLFLNLDDFLVGKMFGTFSLGVYQQAYRISSLPVSEVGEVFNKVTFPVYATIEQDRKRLNKAFLKTFSVITLLVVPFGAIVYFFPELIVKTLLGYGWESTIPVLKILAVYGVVKAISNSFFSLFLALNKQEIVTLITFIGILAMGITIYPLGLKYGMVGIASSTIISTLVSIPFTLYYYLKIINEK